MRTFKTKYFSKAVAFVMAAALICSATGCGKSGNNGGNGDKTGGKNSGNSSADPEYTYVAEYAPLDVAEDADFYRAKLVDGKLYYISYEYDEETFTSEQSLHVYSVADGKDTGSYVLGKDGGKESADGSQVYHSVDNFAIKKDGSFLGIESVYDYTDPEDMKHQASLCVYDKDFNQVEKLDLFQTLKNVDADSFYISQFVCDEADRLYLVADSQIYLFDADLKYQGTVDLEDTWVSACGTGRDGNVYVSMYDQGSNGMVVRMVDFEGRKLGDVHTGFMNGGAGSIVPGPEGDFMAYDDTRVYDYSLADNRATVLLSWLDCDILGSSVRSVFAMEDGRLGAVMQDWTNNEKSLVYLKKVKKSELTPKTTITLGSLYSDQELLSAAVAFNKQSRDYCIDIKYYYDDLADYTENGWNDAVTALNKAVISPDAPDLVAVSNINIAPLAAKGAFEDLGSYMDQSGKIHRSDYLDNVLEAATYSGRLVYVPKSFYVQTLVGKASNVGSKRGWTVKDIMALSKAHPDAALFEYATKEYMLNFCMAFNGNAFIDYNTGKCNFDSPEFREILEFVAGFPDDFEWSEDGDSLPTRWQQDKVLLDQVYISALQDIQIYPEMFGAPVTYVGFPTTDGSIGCMLQTGGAGLAITSKSAHKDGAWEFIEFYLARDDEMYSYGLPARKQDMQKLIDEELNVEYLKDENGNLILENDGSPIPLNGHGSIGYDDWEYTYHNCTQEEIDEVQGVIAQARPAATLDEQIMKMILEEAAPYFARQKGVEDVASVIQSRVQLYLNENR